MVWKFTLPSRFRRTDDNGNRQEEKRTDLNQSKLGNRLFRRSRRTTNPIQIDVEYHEEKPANSRNEMLDDDECQCQSPTIVSSCGLQSRSCSFDFNDQDSGVILRSSCGDFHQQEKSLYSEISVELPKSSAGTIDIVIGGGADQILKTPVVQRIVPASETTRTKSVAIGDQVISINGHHVEKMKLAKIQQIIKQSKSPVKFLLHRQFADQNDGGNFTSDTQVVRKQFEEMSISLPNDNQSVVSEEQPQSPTQPLSRSATVGHRRPAKPFTRNEPGRYSLRTYSHTFSTFGSPSSPNTTPTVKSSFFPNNNSSATESSTKTPSCSTSSNDTETVAIFRGRSYSEPLNRHSSVAFVDDVLQLSPGTLSRREKKGTQNSKFDYDAPVAIEDVDLWPVSQSRNLFKSKSFSLKSPMSRRQVPRERFNIDVDHSMDNNNTKQIMHSRSAYDRLRSSFRKRRGKRTLNGQASTLCRSPDSVTLKSVNTSIISIAHVKLVKVTDDKKVFKFTYDSMLELGISVGGGALSTYGDCAPFVQNIRPGSLGDGCFEIGDIFAEVNGKATKKMTSSEVTTLLKDCVNRKVYIVMESEPPPKRAPKSPRSP